MRTDQFSEAVKRTLYQVARILEEEETLQYLNNNLTVPSSKTKITVDNIISQGSGSQIKSIQEIADTASGSNYSCTRVKPRIFISTRHGSNTIQESSRIMQNKLRERYLHDRALLDDILIRLLSESYIRPIEDRINFQQLNEILDRELDFNGLNIPHYFSVINKEGNEIYRSKGFEAGQNNGEYYTQILFPNDPSPQPNYLKIFFPTRNSYILSSMTLALPSMIFTSLLLFTFILTIYLISRQKRLSESGKAECPLVR